MQLPHSFIPNPISVIFISDDKLEKAMLSSGQPLRFNSTLRNPFHTKIPIIRRDQPHSYSNSMPFDILYSSNVYSSTSYGTPMVSKRRNKLKSCNGTNSSKYCNAEFLKNLPNIMNRDFKKVDTKTFTPYPFPGRSTMITPLRLFSKIKKKESNPVLALNADHREANDKFPTREKKPIQYRNINLLMERSKTLDKLKVIKSKRDSSIEHI